MGIALYATRTVAADRLFASMWLLVEGQPQRIEKVKWYPVTEIWFDRGPKMTVQPTDYVTVINCRPGQKPVPLHFS
jgi:hypothetical protein